MKPDIYFPKNKRDYVISTDRLNLRLVKKEDISQLFDLSFQNESLTEFMTWTPPVDISETEGFVRYMLEAFPKNIYWVIQLDTKIIGAISLEDFEPFRGKRILAEMEAGFWLHPSYHNQGLMTEAFQAVLDWAFTFLPMVHKIKADHIEGNEGSSRVQEKCGMRLIGFSHKAMYTDRWRHVGHREIINPNFDITLFK